MQTLHRWCTYINLDHTAFIPYLATAKELKHTKAAKILEKLGSTWLAGIAFFRVLTEIDRTEKRFRGCAY